MATGQGRPPGRGGTRGFGRAAGETGGGGDGEEGGGQSSTGTSAQGISGGGGTAGKARNEGSTGIKVVTTRRKGSGAAPTRGCSTCAYSTSAETMIKRM